MVPPKLKFWPISRKKNLETQQEPALKNGFLQTLLSSNDNIVLLMNSGFVQYNAPLEKYVKVAQ